MRASRFDLPLTYDAGDSNVRVGDVVRVDLRSREVLAFAVSPVREVETKTSLKPVLAVSDVPRAFDEEGLALARFISERYVCTLGEALSAVVLSGALPRSADTLVPAVAAPQPERYAAVPARLLQLLWTFPDGVGLDALLRHPEARRSGDRAALLRHVQALVRSGDVRRERRFLDPRTQEYRIVTLWPGDTPITGRKARALVTMVRDRPGLPRSEAVLAGFSNAVIARAVQTGALRAQDEVPARVPRERPAESAAGPPLTTEQRVALDRIGAWLDERTHRTALLFGVTGSGKTRVYLDAIDKVVREGGRAIVLVPEISLTPQTVARFERVFGDRVAVLHSALSERERFEAWQACMRGEVDVAVGARSAVFAPLPGVRLIVVDEAHESTYKQDGSPRYHAVTVAAERMRLASGLLVLGSATPSLESYAAALSGRIELLELPTRATAQPMPAVSVVDLGAESESGVRAIFSSRLVDAIGARLERGEKIVLLVNRRGSAGFVLCRACAHVPQCPRCSVSLTVHRAERLLRCHYCDFQMPLPYACPECGSEEIKDYGIGTERVAEEVGRLFPGARVARMDSDSTTHVGDHARILREFEESGDVLVGTQMVAKGLDFPTVTLAGVVAADTGLHLPDFRAAERSFALIAQVCGRSGRASAGEAIVQTYSPEHPAIERSAHHDYAGFARRELQERREANYPPYVRLVYLGVFGRSRARAWEAARAYAALLDPLPFVEVLGPAPFPVAKMNDEWRFRIVLKTQRAAALRAAIRERVLPAARADRATRLAVNVDP